MNEILLRRKNKILLCNGTGSAVQPNEQYIATISKNIEYLGYTFSKELFEVLRTYSDAELCAFYEELVPLLKKQVGADVIYNPMYLYFPKSVMEADYAVLYVNAMVHYWSYGTLYPCQEKNARLPLFEESKVKVLRLGTQEDLYDIFYDLCTSKTSISNADKEDIQWIFKNMRVQFPEEIPLKENVALIGKLYLENYPLAAAKDIQRFFKTATDVLRLITAMSNGDISLAENTRFRSFKRRERRLIMELLQNCGDIEEDMQRYRNRWVRAGERIHPGEYSSEQFGKVITAFHKLRNNIKIETFAGQVDKAVGEKNYQKAIELLKTRPGEFARRLDYMLRISDDKEAVLNAFEETAEFVATPLLLQVREHFAYRTENLRIRVFYPKGEMAKCYSIANNLPPIEKQFSDRAANICEAALVDIYSRKEPLGKVYLSEEFQRYKVPFGQRSAGKALKTVARGSRIPLPGNAKAVRSFIWWTNTDDERFKEGIVDLDLSAAIFDSNWNYMEHISYTNLRSHKYNSCHSGDIVNGGPVDGNGVSEFLDIDIGSVVKYGARYVVYQVYCYSGHIFSELPHAMFGWMNRQNVNSGEIYEPKTVEQKMALVSPSRISIPVVFDCVNREFIWCDMNLTIIASHEEYGGNNVESNLYGVAAACYNVINKPTPNLYDLVMLHIKGRGERTFSKEEADVVFDVEEGITPFDTEVFLSQYL